MLIRWVAAASVSALFAAPAARLLMVAVLSLESVVSRHPAFMLGPAAGACLVFLLLRFQGATVSGTGTDSYIHRVASDDVPPTVRAGFFKLVATVLTVGSGGSGGLIGPSLFIGAACARISRLLLTSRSLIFRPSELSVIGAAAMLGALLGAPVGGALLAVEVLRRTGLEGRMLAPALLGSWGGYLAHSLIPGDRQIPAPLAVSYDFRLLGLALITALLAAGSGLALVWLLAAVRKSVRARQLGGWAVVPAGLVVGLLGMAVGPEILGWGLPRVLDTWMAGSLPGGRVWLLLPAKITATAITVGSGGSGGVMAPALVTGALAGAGVTQAAGLAHPALMVAGMAACLAAVSNVPLAAAVLLLEWLGPAVAPLALTGSLVGFGLGRSWVAYSFTDPEADTASEEAVRATV